MSFALNIIRNLLGALISLADVLTRPSKRVREPQEQAQVEREIESMSIYQFVGCPFCVKTRRALHKMNLPINLKNATHGSEYRKELEEQGGKVQVPCLRIENEKGVEWMYESSDIIQYLEQRFA